MNSALLSVENLSITFRQGNQVFEAVKNLSYELFPNQILGIVGESGSGKSVSSMAIMQLLSEKNTAIAGEIWFEDQNLLTLPSQDIQKIRTRKIGMIFQEPMSALNPSMTCGKQVSEVLRWHLNHNNKDAKKVVLELFKQVKLPDPEKIWHSYPHQISGGQKQRVIIAMAIACKPKIIIADEPTTALDVTVQNDILELLKNIQKTHQIAIIFISHDLNLIKNFCQKVIVMKDGQKLEEGEINNLFNHPQNIYTKALLATKPSQNIRFNKLLTVSDFINNNTQQSLVDASKRIQKIEAMSATPPLLELVNLNKTYWNKMGYFSKKQGYQAVKNISIKVFQGETLGLVGESGCGKSTLGNLILKLDTVDSGQIFYKGTDITQLSETAFKKYRKNIHVIFQDPFASLNPKITVGAAILEPMIVHGIGKNNADRTERVIELLKKVGLDEASFNKYPKEFSGGQRQRIGIARAIALEPEFVVCDESVSALDVSVQAQVLNLLNQLKEDYQFTYLFISHDLTVVKYMSDHIAVMQQGEIVEYQEADMLYKYPTTDYTKKLIASMP